MALTVHQRSRVPAPVPAVWEVVADPFRRPEWMAGITGVHGEVPKGVPLLAEQRFTVDGRVGLFWRFTAREEVTAVWPGTMVAFHGESGPVTYLLTLTLSELAGESTALDWDMEVRPAHESPSLLDRLAVRLARRIIARLARRSLVNLRKRPGQGPGRGTGTHTPDSTLTEE